MKIRIMGAADLVQAWAAELERSYGVEASIYPCRGSEQLRAYVDIDDRTAQDIAKSFGTDSPAKARALKGRGAGQRPKSSKALKASCS